MPVMLEARYRTYRFGGRDVITLPAAAPQVRLAGVQALPALTLRASAFRTGLEALVRLRLDLRMGVGQDGPVGSAFGLDGWRFVCELRQQLGRDDVLPVVIYPRQADRRRLYMHLLAANGERIAFAKLASGPEDEVHVGNAGRALQAMARSSIRSFRYPNLLAAGTFQGHSYLLLAPLPSGSRPLPPRWSEKAERVRAEIGGPPFVAPRLDAASWWPRFSCRSEEASGLWNVLAPERQRPFEACAAHGDFVNWNIYQHRADWWVFDWEGYATDAPLLSDPVRFFLGIHTRAISHDPRGGRALLVEHFGARDRVRHGELSRALAFLCGNGVAAALAVGAIWREFHRA